MKEPTLLVSVSNIPMIKYDGIEVKLVDLLKWRDELYELKVDLNKVVVFADINLSSAFQRSLLSAGIAKIHHTESIIPFPFNQRDLDITESLEFVGLSVYENEQIVMKVYVYEFYNH